MEYFGNKVIVNLHKTAFLCSRKCPADIVLKSLDWAKSKKAVEQERLLIISPFDETVTHIIQETANKRNEIMVDIADEVFLAYATKDGNLDELLKGIKDKKIKTFE